MQSKAATVAQYLAQLPPDRRSALETVRKTVLANLDKGFEEGMQYGMIGYYVPHSVYPPGYHCDPRQPLPFMGLASQKNHMSLYMCTLYTEPSDAVWFQQAWGAEVVKGNAKRLDMGKGCVRFKKIEDVPLSVIAAAVKRAPLKRVVASYERNLEQMRAAKGEPTKPATAKSTQKTTKKSAARPAKKATPTAIANKAAKKATKKIIKKVTKKVAKRSAARA